MNDFKLSAEQWEDFSDLLICFEDMFNIRFTDEELLDIMSFDDLVTLAISKIQLEDENTCTTQRAFYQVRNAINQLKTFDTDKLTPNSRLEDIFPKKNRNESVERFEATLGVEPSILRINRYVAIMLLSFFMLSFFGLFFNPYLGGLGIGLDILGWLVASKFAKTFRYTTVRELIENIVCANYLLFRKNKNTINRKELPNLITAWFANNMALEKKQIQLIQFK